MNVVDRAARLAMIAHNGTNRDDFFGYGEPLFARIPVCAHARAMEKSRKQVLLRLAVANGTV